MESKTILPPLKNETTKPSLVGLLPDEIATLLTPLGIEKYRAKQIFQRLYTRRSASFEEYKEVPKSLRTRLEEEYALFTLKVEDVQHSEDGTKKFLFRLADGKAIETVLIPSEMKVGDGLPKRRTICVSTQVGCPLSCAFCATGSLKLKRNLTAGEIVEQFLLVQEHSDQPITNLVFMGMGEPLLNLDNVLKAVDILSHDLLQLLSPRRITISTAGLADKIRLLADQKRTLKLALSLHATTDSLRLKLMPINKKFSLKTLGDTLEYYYRMTKVPITYEYILFEGLNDTPDDVKRLAKITRRVPSKVNVIPFHDIGFTAPEGIAATLKRTTSKRFDEFIRSLQQENVTVMVRSSSGEDIDGACGQLAFSGEKKW